MKTVYDPQGKPVEMEGVDARECVEHSGYTWERQTEKETPVVAEEVKDAEEKGEAPSVKRGRPSRKR